MRISYHRISKMLVQSQNLEAAVSLNSCRKNPGSVRCDMIAVQIEPFQSSCLLKEFSQRLQIGPQLSFGKAQKLQRWTGQARHML